MENKKVSTEAYKGVRDFYPEDMAIEQYIFEKWRETAESFGYQEYGASVLEPTELYKAKSGDEIVNEQTYSFRDRGDRDVTLRPEMTPTVARMIAAKVKSFSFPLRWYSIPNVFRYERPQRGRLREHFQFNADIFGINSIDADVEIISIAYHTLKVFGLSDEQFGIKIGSRKLIAGLDEKQIHDLDKKNATDAIEDLKRLGVPLTLEEVPEETGLKELLEKLKAAGVTNAKYDPTIIRGFAYYTGTVFEGFDTNPENPRAICGGGRYDNLLDIFGTEKVSAVGFGMGDVVIRDILETYNLLPTVKPASQLHICVMGEANMAFAQELAQKVRDAGVNATIDYSGKKVGDQIKYAEKNNIPFITVIGEEEVKSGNFTIKRLSDGVEKLITSATEKAEDIFNYINEGKTRIEKRLSE